MSSKAVAATTRDIRKAFGPEVLDTIDRQGQAIESLQKAERASAFNQQGAANRLTKHDALLVLIEARLSRLERPSAARRGWLWLRGWFRGR